MPAWGHHVQRRGRIYHLRVRLPVDIRTWVGHREVRRSLETDCPHVARQRAAELFARLQLALGNMRSIVAAANNDNIPAGDVRDQLIAVLKAALKDAWSVIELERKSGQMRLETLKRRMLTEQLQATRQQTAALANLATLLQDLETEVANELRGEKAARRVEALGEIREFCRELTEVVPPRWTVWRHG